MHTTLKHEESWTHGRRGPTHSQRLLLLRSCRRVRPAMTAQQRSVGSSRLPKPAGARVLEQRKVSSVNRSRQHRPGGAASRGWALQAACGSERGRQALQGRRGRWRGVRGGAEGSGRQRRGTAGGWGDGGGSMMTVGAVGSRRPEARGWCLPVAARAAGATRARVACRRRRRSGRTVCGRVERTGGTAARALLGGFEVDAGPTITCEARRMFR